MVNPWLPAPAIEEPSEAPAEQLPPAARVSGPQAGVVAADALPTVKHFSAPALWVVGTHGGSGESLLAQLREGWAPGGHAWPEQQYSNRAARVLLACRGSAHGLNSARAAAMQWAAGKSPTVELIGLVVVADAPGRAPKPLRDLAALVGGGVPRLWHVPWIEAWRLGAPVDHANPPRETARLLNDLDLIFNPGTPGATAERTPR
ncbi:DUF6668 family protein [Litorihabitans aurantiacus]|uniref:Uncharacterized protein n=1 Tax=Litorihabitans aurantiacus TaxID=1930061 RepID=A0AA37XIZ8_9MICO|nr:DUF6668 family protein [Litorihabitans aurantiacus]GMA33726.1 hypothetical protein GCM10025875_37180 [Litorihabitans aurantiacus]